jgi:hypothetical protein
MSFSAGSDIRLLPSGSLGDLRCLVVQPIVHAEAMSIQDCAVGGFIVVGVGVLLLVFRRPFARFAIRSQNRFWGFHYDEKVVERSARYAAPIIAVGMIVVGLLGVFVLPCQR